MAKIDWINYTPYENRVNPVSFVLFRWTGKRAHALIEFFLKDPTPARMEWLGQKLSGRITACRATIRRYAAHLGGAAILSIGESRGDVCIWKLKSDQTLVLGFCSYQDWIDSPAGDVGLKICPHTYGEISLFNKKRERGNTFFSISGNVRLPVNGIKIKKFSNGSKLPLKVTVNGNEMKNYKWTRRFQLTACSGWSSDHVLVISLMVLIDSLYGRTGKKAVITRPSRKTGSGISAVNSPMVPGV